MAKTSPKTTAETSAPETTGKKPTPTRVYVITYQDKEMPVEATSPYEALKFTVGDSIKVSVANHAQILSYARNGINIPLAKSTNEQPGTENIN